MSAMPGLLMPSTLPAWKAVPHTYAANGPHAHVAFGSGDQRPRRVSIPASHQLQASMMLTPTQAAVLCEWMQVDAEAGALPFAAGVLSPSGALEWWRAWFTEQPQWAAVLAANGPFWQVQCSLRLEGSPAAEPPT